MTGVRNVDMVTNNGLMRIFWPSDTPTKPTAGVLVGWRNSELDIFVVTVLREVEVSTTVRDMSWQQCLLFTSPEQSTMLFAWAHCSATRPTP